MAISMFLVALAAAPTLAQVESASPQAAGELLLPADHGVIATAGRAARHPMDLPGFAEFVLVEKPEPMAGGCVRRQWKARFRSPPDGPETNLTFQSVYPSREVALSTSSGCPDDGYALLNGGVSPEQGTALLRQIDDISSGRQKVRFTCVSHTDQLCASDQTTRTGLQAIKPWSVKRSGQLAELWLGVPGQIVTIVKFSTPDTEQVAVERKVPAPF